MFSGEFSGVKVNEVSHITVGAKSAPRVRLDLLGSASVEPTAVLCLCPHKKGCNSAADPGVYRGLLSKVSAVDHEFGARHEARLVGGKEKTTVRDFKWGASTLHRGSADDVGVDRRVLSLG